MKKSLKKGVGILLTLSALMIPQIFTSCPSTPDGKTERPSSPSAGAHNVIHLDGNVTTGYNWEYTVEPEGIISLEEKQVYRGGENVCGAGSDFFFTITGLEPGTCTIHFVYRRNWEETEWDIKEDYDVEVALDKSVSITHR